MARRPADDPDRTIACPHCGEAIRRSASSCHHCGSDRATGWADPDAPDAETDVELPEAMSDEEHAEFVARELGDGATDRDGRRRAPLRLVPGDAISAAQLRRRRNAAIAIALALLYLFGRYALALL
ncbi:MAG: hypothetical protein JNL90_06045 [Planctomycetes bacterium]|nr:hypothetical protein [Planctomycetota bacterium]